MHHGQDKDFEGNAVDELEAGAPLVLSVESLSESASGSCHVRSRIGNARELHPRPQLSDVNKG